MRELIIVDDAKKRKCPLTRLRCMAGACALWFDAGVKQVHARYYSGSFRMGCCTLSRNR